MSLAVCTSAGETNGSYGDLTTVSQTISSNNPLNKL